MCSASGMGDDEDLGAWLGLGIGGGGDLKRSHGEQRSTSVQLIELLLAPPPAVKEERGRDRDEPAEEGEKVGKCARIKRVKIVDEVDDDGAGARKKKLRLTKEQSALLDDNFRANNILPQDEKNELARRMNLSVRQVEVWFQNRRARTKIKQTEVDCKLLKRRCESLTDENRRLKQELTELQRLAAAAAGLDVQLPRSTLGDGERPAVLREGDQRDERWREQELQLLLNGSNTS